MPTRQEDAEAYYREFWRRDGLDDWLHHRPRQEQLKLFVGAVLRGPDTRRILDLGCGTGVMTDWLRTYGEAMGTDFSEPAIELGRALAPRVELHVQPLEDIQLDGDFDVICAFDVIEHVPPPDRPALFGRIGTLLAAEGLIIVSTPHPRFSRWMAERRPELMQVVDEPVDLRELVELAASANAELIRYETFDINWRRQYQFAVFQGMVEVGSEPRINRALRLRLALRSNPIARRLRRARIAARLRRGGL
ncbi:MAG TPA: class I SAM-dependent methyltransferase [Thermoleophilaceae bacterium]|nr:class I SAM-dependent methyltransferase [Thermoleophilaceae bacterium]